MSRQYRERVDPSELPLVGFDTEDDSKGHPTLFGFAWKDNLGRFKHFQTKSREEAVRWIYSRPTSLFVAHNLEYDLVNLFRDSDYNELDQIVYTAKPVYAKLKNRDHIFYDTFNWYAGSLKSMGKLVGLEKLEVVGDAFDDPAYNARDCEIVVAFTEMLITRVRSEFALGIKATIGSLAMHVFRSNYLSKWTANNSDLALDAYYGGRCEVFWRGKIKKHIRVADVNSEYPFAMTWDFPDTSNMITGRTLDARFGVAKVDIRVPRHLVPPLPMRRDDGLLFFPWGRLTGTWTLHEIREAVALGARVERVHESITTDREVRPFAQFIESVYAMRLAGDNEFEKLWYKLLMNNSYGKLVERSDRLDVRGHELSEKELAKGQGRLVRKTGNLWVYEWPRLEPPETANYMWGAHVTSYGRIHLLRQLRKVADTEGSTLLYCDTDSVMWSGKGDPGLDLDQKRLGALKVDDYPGGGEFFMPKGYVLRYKEDGVRKSDVACKGVPLPRDFDRSKEGTMADPRIKFMRTGIAKAVRPARLRASLATGEIANYWREVVKERRGDYTRRKGKEGQTKALRVMEW
jgi:hypothetical protein